ncbi:MAG: L-threonine 3-dehydrogenase [bacterium]
MAKKMRAIIKKKGEFGAVLDEVAIPEPTSDEVLVKVKATSICGTDVHIYEWNPWAQGRIKRLPQILGHEFAGEVVEIGSCVKNIKVGDYISAETHIPCYHCKACLVGQFHICENLKILGVDRDGSFAEYITIPESVAWVNDRSIPPEIASIQEPLGNAVYTTTVTDVFGQSIAIFGDGPIGLFATGVARTAGATRVITIGMMPFCLDIAKKMGADATINITEVDDVARTVIDTNGGEKVDIALEMAGVDKAVSDTFNVVRKGGRVSAFGILPGEITIDYNNALVFKGTTVYGINGRLMYETWCKVRNLLSSKRLDISPVITHKFPLEDYAKGFELMLEVPKKVGKVVLFP